MVVDLVDILTSDVYVYLCCYACYCELVTIEFYLLYDTVGNYVYCKEKKAPE